MILNILQFNPGLFCKKNISPLFKKSNKKQILINNGRKKINNTNEKKKSRLGLKKDLYIMLLINLIYKVEKKNLQEFDD